MSEELQLRIDHLRDALRKAAEFAATGDWEESLYHADEARLLLQAIERDERLTNLRNKAA